MKKTILPVLAVAATLMIFNACTEAPAEDKWVKPGAEDLQKQVQTMMINAKDGDTLFFDEGTFEFVSGLSIDGVENLTLKGKGMDKTIFSFKNQTDGAEGVHVTGANGFLAEDLAIEDSQGDAIKVKDTDGLTFRRVRVEWTGGPDSTNGSYGLYPVACKNVLMEESIARGASDAGIYVGQTTNAIVRNNLVEYNVAGIEIENTTNAEVYGNTATNNTAGLLVFDLPDLPTKNGGNVRVYDNLIKENNQANFSPQGISVSIVPAGIGFLFMACQGVEAFDNTVVDNKSIGAIIVNLDQMGRKTEDSLFNIYPSNIYLHDNKFSRAESVPDTTRDLGMVMYKMFGTDLPMVLFDGVKNPDLVDEEGNFLPEHRICISGNENVTFFNMAEQSTEKGTYDCTLESIPELEWNKEMTAEEDAVSSL